MAEKPVQKKPPRKQRSDVQLRMDKRGVVHEKDKLDLFLEEYVANGGNATRAAMKVYNTSSYRSAQALGSISLKKAKDIGRFVLEEQGGGLPHMIKHAMSKMEDSETPEWWDRLMKFGGYADFMGKSGGGPAQPAVVNIVQSEKQILSKYMDAELVDELTETIEQAVEQEEDEE